MQTWIIYSSLSIQPLSTNLCLCLLSSFLIIIPGLVVQVRAGAEGGEGGRVLAQLLLPAEPRQAILRPQRPGEL